MKGTNVPKKKLKIEAKKEAKKEEMVSYYLLNLSGIALSLDTKLKCKAANGRSRAVSIELFSDRRPHLLQDKDGYSAKQLFESRGVSKYAEKGKVRKILKKQPLSVA